MKQECVYKEIIDCHDDDKIHDGHMKHYTLYTQSNCRIKQIIM